MARWQGKSSEPQRWKNTLTLPRPGEERRSLAVGVLAKKVSKEEAKYRQSMNEAENKQSCAECQNFLNPGSMYSDCLRVAGVVEARDTCDIFVQRQGSGAGPQPQESIGVSNNE